MASQGTQDEEKHKTICGGHHYKQANTNNVYIRLQTTGGKDEQNIVFMRKS